MAKIKPIKPIDMETLIPISPLKNAKTLQNLLPQSPGAVN